MKKRNLSKIILLGFMAAVLFLMSMPEIPVINAKADEAVTEIRTTDELIAAAKNSTGNYKLMANLDMNGIEWTPWDFSGTFDGNGYSILNLDVKTVSAKTMTTYDGNRKSYETHGAGFFGVLTNANVSNLKLVAPRVELTQTQHCFAAPIAGLSDNSKIKNCEIVDGYVSLTDSAIMWGVGGIVGFGSGDLDSVITDVTLICVDTDKNVKDEQFMGGAYGAGFLNIRDCVINIDGYDSDHGYVHNGGLSGMYMVYPYDLSLTYKGEVHNNQVNGMITFYEDNKDRRAYCAAAMGEVMNWTYSYTGFKSDFKRNETYDYSVTLKPDMCANPSYADTVTAPTATTFGYTTHKCNGCGYTYNDNYTIHEHKTGEFEELLDGSGLEAAKCSLCNDNVYQNHEDPVSEEYEVTGEDSQSTNKDKSSKDKTFKTVVIIGVVAVVVLVILLLVLRVIKVRNDRKRRSRKRSR